MHSVDRVGALNAPKTSLRFLILLFALIAHSAIALAQGPAGDRYSPDMSIDAATRTEVVRALSKNLKQRYVFPEVADKLATMLEDHDQRGDYNSITSAKDFSRLLTTQMETVAHDAHLHVQYASTILPPPPQGQGPGPAPHMLRDAESNNFGFQELKRLSGNIGYLKITGFSDAERGGPIVAAAMTFLAHTDALIIDLRQNRGGDPGMVDLLASYFFDARPVHLNDLSRRKEGTTQNSIEQFWTLPYVPGERYLNREVYILVSHDTASAAEEFTYDLQTLKRATVVGASTWGGANPGGMVPLSDHFVAFIPTGEAINPITKTNWEGKGVQPNLAIPVDNAFKAAYTMALQHLIAATNDRDALLLLKQALTHVQSDGENAVEP